MDAIAAEAGVSKLTIYSHFTDKDRLFSAAVEATCMEQIPELYVDAGPQQPIEQVLLSIGRGFHQLVNNDQGIELHRLMAAQAGINAPMTRLFFEAGPQRIISQMERLLIQADHSGQLRIPCAQTAADHLLSMLKGGENFRRLIGYCSEPRDAQAAENHVSEVVRRFVRAYRP
jgi:TetR/AcrR family transcriptional repressor of mexJK operon